MISPRHEMFRDAGLRRCTALWLAVIVSATAFAAAVFWVSARGVVRRTRLEAQARVCAERTERAARQLEAFLQMNGYTDLHQLRADARPDADMSIFATGSQHAAYVLIANRLGQVVLHTDRSQEGTRLEDCRMLLNCACPSTSVTRVRVAVAGSSREMCDAGVPIRLGGSVQGMLRMGFMAADVVAPDDAAVAACSVGRAGLVAVAACGAAALCCMVLLAHGLVRRFDQSVQAERRSGEEKIEVIGAGIAHEVKNALNGIRMNAQLLQQHCGSLPPDIRDQMLKKVARIEDEAARTGSMLGEFLSYAKPATFRPAPVNLVALLDDLAQFFEHECRSRDIALSFSCPPVLTAVLADEQLLRHGITNLMWNAIQAVDRKGTITLSGDRREGQVILSVTDSGGGIEPAAVPRVFDLFFSTKQRGAGLGLSIVQRVARMHGGEALLENRPGRGCIFSISFPLHQA